MARSFSKIFKGRWAWAAFLTLAIVLVATPIVASAQEQGIIDKAIDAVTPDIFSLDNVTQTFISGLAFGISYLLSLIGGVFIAILSWFLEIILNISFGLVNSAPVKIGFPIVLSIANLFFVGALIVIAISTILRREEYGMKKVLWKLVVMAVMVNFGLVICGSLLSVSDEVTKFFIQSVAPGSTGDEKQDIFKFSDSIAGAFNPRAAFISMDDVVQNPALAQEDLRFFSEAGDNFGRTIKPIVGLLSTLGSLIVIIITLATLNAMLLWRYIRLGLALIVLPLAWASWIFPTYQEHYRKWWTKFTQWAIFPPVVVFFLWLGLKVSEVMSNQSGEYAPLWNPDRGNGVPNPLSDFLGNLITPVISQTLKTFILFGIMMGGIVAAQEMGIKFADGGYKAIENAGGWAKGKAMNYAKRAARSTYQGAGGRRLNETLIKNKWGQKSGALLKPILTTIGSGAAGLGRGMEGATQGGGSAVVEDYAKGIPHDTDGKIARLAGNNNMPEILAILSSLKADELSKVKTIGGEPLWEWLEKNHQKIEDYGQHELEKNLKDMGATHGLLAALGGHGNLGDAVAEAMGKGDPKVLAKLMKKGAGLGMESADALQDAMMRGIGENFSPQDLADFTAKLNKEQLDNFKAAMGRVIKTSEQANAILGKENADYFRKNGMARTRGLRSEIWGETGKAEAGTSGDIASGDSPAAPDKKGSAKEDHGGHAAPAASHAPAPAASHAPAPSGGGDHGGGGGDHGGGHH